MSQKVRTYLCVHMLTLSSITSSLSLPSLRTRPGKYSSLYLSLQSQLEIFIILTRIWLSTWVPKFDCRLCITSHWNALMFDPAICTASRPTVGSGKSTWPVCTLRKPILGRGKSLRNSYVEIYACLAAGHDRGRHGDQWLDALSYWAETLWLCLRNSTSRILYFCIS